ncbi:MAG: hypothetical protein ABI645_13315 [Pseudomonadota bacterium]
MQVFSRKQRRDGQDTGRAIVLVSWDGKDRPLSCVAQDAAPEFDIVLFDYTGTHSQVPAAASANTVALISQRTECKGEIYRHFAAWVKNNRTSADYVALIDDDVLISVSALNMALHQGRQWNLDVFSPTLDPRSAHSHDFMIAQPAEEQPRYVDWVEVMMPFYRTGLLLETGSRIGGNISSWGIDKYLVPTIQWLRGKTRTALLDCVVAVHERPITSGFRRFRNGWTADEEMRLMKWKARNLARRSRWSHQPAAAMPPTLHDELECDLRTLVRQLRRRYIRRLRSLAAALFQRTTTLSGRLAARRRAAR